MPIRRATSVDLPAVASLHIATAAEIRELAPEGFGGPLGNMPGTGAVSGKFRDMLDDSDNLLLVAEEDGRIVGFANGWREMHDDDLIEAPYMTIEYVEVHPDYRRRGIARELIAELESEARRRGLKRIDLLVLATHEAARRLYDKLGYGAIEVRMGKVIG